MKAKRKLTTILSADVFGYARLMADDEHATLETLTKYRELIRNRVTAHGGRVVDSPGDALLAEFASAVEAVECGVEIQRELARRNSQLAEHRRMLFRFGINLGDVIEEKGALYGDGVNIAARLESLADPGGISISNAVREAVEGKLAAKFRYLGEQRVKNIDKPVLVYRVETRSPEASSAHASSSRTRRRRIAVAVALTGVVGLGVLAVQLRAGFAPKPSSSAAQDPALAVPTGPAIAVLAFDNMSGDPKQDYFGDGLAEEIISGLSRFRHLRILARNSTFQYKGKSKDVRDIGREIGADYVVEGSVRRAGDNVRVTAQLLDAHSGAHVWAETYERQLDPGNVFAVQDQITSQVVARIGDVHGAVNWAGIEQSRAKGAPALDDYECVLRFYEYNRFLTPDKHVPVKECLHRALERNPNYTDAWASLAYIYADQYWGEYEGPKDPLQRAYEAARRAVELDPGSAYAHFTLANVYFFRKNFDEFFVEAEKALALNPNNTEIVAALALRYVYAGKRDRGLALMKKAIALSPSHPGWYLNGMLYDHYLNREYETSLEVAKRVDMPGFLYANLALAMNYGQLGQQDLAQRPLAALQKLNPGFEKEPHRYLDMWFRPEDSDHIIDGLRKAGLQLPPRQKQ